MLIREFQALPLCWCGFSLDLFLDRRQARRTWTCDGTTGITGEVRYTRSPSQSKRGAPKFALQCRRSARVITNSWRLGTRIANSSSGRPPSIRFKPSSPLPS